MPLINIASLLASGYTPAQNPAELPHYDTNVGEDLPPGHSPIGVLAEGNYFYQAYDLLTPKDLSFLKEVTGQPFDPATIAAEQAAGTFQNNGLAAAIGTDRADSILGPTVGGPGGLAGNVTASYLHSIEAAISNPQGDGLYDGIQISRPDLVRALSALDPQSGSAVNVVA